MKLLRQLLMTRGEDFIKLPSLNFWSKRSAPTVDLEDTPGMLRLFGYPHEAAGVSVNERSALAISTVYACIRVIAEGVASLPWHIYEKTDDGRRVAYEHPLYNLLNAQPNPYNTSFTFRETLLVHLLLGGNGVAWIKRGEGNRPESLWLIPNGEHRIQEHEGELYYHTKYGVLSHLDVIHVPGLGFDGISGKSPIRLQQDQLSITLAAQKFGANFFANGAHVSTVLEHPKALSDKQFDNLKKSIQETKIGLNNVAKPWILEDGMKLSKMGIPPNEAQFLETRKMGATEVCGMYRVPPHMVAILDRSTNNNIEHQGIDFVQHTLLPWLIRIEQEFNRKLFRDSERGRFSCGFNVNGLLKGDIKAQTAHTESMLDRGVYSINMALSFLGQNTIGPEGDRRFVMQNMMPLDKVDEIINNQKSINTPA